MQSVLIALLLTTLVHSSLLGLLALLAARRTADPSRRGWLLRAAIVAPLLTAGVQVAAGGWLGWGGWALPGAGLPAADAGTVAATPPALDGLTPSSAARRVKPSVEPAPDAPREGGANGRAAWRTWALCIWIAGAALGVLDLVLARRRFLAALRRSRFRDADARRRLQLLTNAREVDLSGSEKLTVPLAISSHEICVPENLWDELTPGEKDALLAHEVAHVERRDPAWFLVEQMIERVLFAQPLLRVLRRASRRAAELACDERAALATQRPIELARCLATVAGWSQRSLVPVSIASMARRDASVVGRVERLLQMEAQPSPPHRQRAFFFGLGAALIAFACAAPGVVADGQASDLRHARALPLEGAALLVEIERNGRAHLASRGGQEPLGTFELNGDTGAFRTALEGAAKKLPRGGPGPLSHMLADGVLRIRTTADTPFYYAQLVMQTCGTRNVMIWNLELETAGRGDAVFPYQLPVDVGVTGDALPGHFEIDLRVRPDAGGGRALEARFGFVAGDPLQEVEESETTDGAESAPVVTIDGVRRDEWRPKEQLDAALDGPAFPSQAAGAVTIRLYDGVTGGEAARLIDQVLDAGATDILFVGVIPR